MSRVFRTKARHANAYGTIEVSIPHDVVSMEDIEKDDHLILEVKKVEKNEDRIHE